MNETYLYEPIDLCACYEPFEDPPADLLKEWCGEPAPTPENMAFYFVEPDGTMYYCFGNTCIKVSEHFAAAGKPLNELVENVIEYAAGETPAVKKSPAH